jgi:hypothetical protein
VVMQRAVLSGIEIHSGGVSGHGHSHVIGRAFQPDSVHYGDGHVAEGNGLLTQRYIVPSDAESRDAAGRSCVRGRYVRNSGM